MAGVACAEEAETDWKTDFSPSNDGITVDADQRPKFLKINLCPDPSVHIAAKTCRLILFRLTDRSSYLGIVVAVVLVIPPGQQSQPIK